MLIKDVEALCASARTEVLLVSPFIKFPVLNRLLESVGSEVPVTAVTRWLPQEIAAGVSDLEIWRLFREDNNRRLFLRHDLHAKFYRGDDLCLIGSANLTGKALGTAKPANLELLVALPVSAARVVQFLEALWPSTIEVTDEVHDTTRALVESLPALPDPIELPDGDDVEQPLDLSVWLPQIRQPQDLFIAYRQELDVLSSAAAKAALADLAVLRIPMGLSADTFKAFIGAALLRMPTIVAVDHFITVKERRFGEVRDYLAERTAGDPSHNWQTLFRWVTYFLPERYTYRRPRQSELIARKEPGA